MDGDGRLAGARGSEGETAPGIAIGGIELSGLFEDSEGGGVLELANQVLTVGDEKGGIVG